ncbi:MAG: flagellar assembly protein FliW [Gemmatimonadaceae bacterium]|jgi:flagellar assembly factor FliW|nr:flagellar assembly protein FliW [Gemmatimonadaceae bacterium]
MSAAAAAASPVVIESPLLGRLEIPADLVITFAAGLPGFGALRRFALLATEEPALNWLQSVDDGAITFLVVDPFSFVADYAVELPPGEIAALGATPDAPPLVLAIATLGADETATLNLQGPLAIDPRTRRGRQVVLPDSPWGMAHPIRLG